MVFHLAELLELFVFGEQTLPGDGLCGGLKKQLEERSWRRKVVSCL